jgi:glycosyltransferase involved in cell wall biosynthesis
VQVEGNKKIRILIVIARLNIGGPAIQALKVADHFSHGRFESLLATGRPLLQEGDMSYLAESLKVKPVLISSLSREINPLRDFLAFLRILTIILKFRPDIVHTHTAKAGAVGRLAAFIAGVPGIIHTFHGHTLRAYFGKTRTNIFCSIERFLSRITDAVVTISPSQRRDLVEVLKIIPRKKAAVIGFGLDTAPFLEVDREAGRIRDEFSIPRDAPVVTIVGRLYPVKDYALFLRSAAALSRRRGDAHFLVVGDGELRGELENLCAQLGITGSVHFLGWRRDLTAIYADSDIVAVTSRNEGTPVSLLEAMACAKPIVATAVGGVPDLFPGKEGTAPIIFARTGILVDSRNPETFADALLTLINDGAMQKRMGSAGKEFVRDNFCEERFFADLEALYRKILRRRF